MGEEAAEKRTSSDRATKPRKWDSEKKGARRGRPHSTTTQLLRNRAPMTGFETFSRCLCARGSQCWPVTIVTFSCFVEIAYSGLILLVHYSTYCTVLIVDSISVAS